MFTIFLPLIIAMPFSFMFSFRMLFTLMFFGHCHYSFISPPPLIPAADVIFSLLLAEFTKRDAILLLRCRHD